MSEDKNVLVLFYDKTDRQRNLQIGEEHTTLEKEIHRGFEGTGVKYNIRTASPSHERWLVKAHMNEMKYDGIIVVAGLSCSLDVPHGLMEDLYDSKLVPINSRDWNRNESAVSQYHMQERPVPIIGVPTRDLLSDGEYAFWAMHMISRPRDAACVGVEKGYDAAKLMARVLNNKWNEIQILVPTMAGEPYEVAKRLATHLNFAFQPYEECNVQFGVQTIFSAVDSRNAPRMPENVLPICVYDDIGQLKAINDFSDVVLGVYIPETKNHFKEYIDKVSQSSSLENVIHLRPGVGQNAALFAAQCLSMHPYTVQDYKIEGEGDDKKKVPVGEPREVWLSASKFKELRRRKSKENVEEFDRLRGKE